MLWGKKAVLCSACSCLSLGIDSSLYLTYVNTSLSRAEVSAGVRASNHGQEKDGAILVAMLAIGS